MTGEVLKRARLNAGLTQAQFAHLAGVTLITIGRVENGKTRPSELTMVKLNRVLEALRRREAQASPPIPGAPNPGGLPCRRA